MQKKKRSTRNKHQKEGDNEAETSQTTMDKTSW